MPPPRKQKKELLPLSKLPFGPPIAPMLAAVIDKLPTAPGTWFEPKWDGFRAIVFVDESGVFLQSRTEKPLARYFPELAAGLAAVLKPGTVLDGEIVIFGPNGLDFDALLMRLHPATTRIAALAKKAPASFVAWDVLAKNGRDVRHKAFRDRRALLETVIPRQKPPLFITPGTSDRKLAASWFRRFEGAGLDGVVAKDSTLPYVPGKRVMQKMKHARTADCVIAGFRFVRDGDRKRVGSLLLGMFDDEGLLQHVGSAAGFSADVGEEMVEALAPLRVNAKKDHPWLKPESETVRTPGKTSRWSSGDMEWEPLVPVTVAEVMYDHMQGDRFRHVAHVMRFRTDKRPRDCAYDQLAIAPPMELKAVFEKPARPRKRPTEGKGASLARKARTKVAAKSSNATAKIAAVTKPAAKPSKSKK